MSQSAVICIAAYGIFFTGVTLSACLPFGLRLGFVSLKISVLTFPIRIGVAIIKLRSHITRAVFFAKATVLTHLARIGCMIA